MAALLGLALALQQAVGDASPGVWGVLVALGLVYWREQVFVLRPVPIHGKHVLGALLAAFAVAVIYDLIKGFPLLPKAATAIGGGVGALFVTRSWRPSRLFGGSRKKTRFVVLQGGRASPAISPGTPRGQNGSGRGGPSPQPPKNLLN